MAELLQRLKGMYKGKKLLAWKIRGRSLEPFCTEGDYFVISTDFDYADEMNVMVQENENEITIKKLKIFKDGTIELKPYGIAPSRTQERNSGKILGEVIGIFKNFILQK